MPFLTSLAANAGYGRLPVSRSSGVRLIFLSAINNSTWTTDVTNKISSAISTFYPTASVTITTITDLAFSGSTLSTATYDVAFVVTNTSFSNAALGTALNNFVAAGGGLVMTAFACTTVAVTNFTYSSYAPTITTGATNNRTTNPSVLGTYTASDPLMNNVTSFNAGTSRYGSQSLTLNSGATTVASYSDGGPLVVKRTIGSARTVVLNFFAPSSDSRSDFWTSSTHGGRLMANAVLWTGKVLN